MKRINWKKITIDLIKKIEALQNAMEFRYEPGRIPFFPEEDDLRYKIRELKGILKERGLGIK